MANADRPVGFKPAENCPYFPPKPYPLVGGVAIAIGDVVILASTGRVTVGATNSAKGLYLGVAATSATTSAAADDEILVWDNPEQIFHGQQAIGALADPYTTRSCGACFDLGGTTGVMYINQASNTYDLFRIVGVGQEPGGDASAVGAYQKKLCKFSPTAHAYGTVA
jgi:hypothetical protein